MARRLQSLAIALSACVVTSCVLPPLDPSGRMCPCANGWSCVGGICVEGTFDAATTDAARIDGGGTDASDAASQADARDVGTDVGPLCEATTTPYCLSDGEVCAGGTIASTVCTEGVLHFCTSGAARTVTCPGACDADREHCAWEPRHVTRDLASTAVVTLAASVAPIWVLDTNDGTIETFATLADIDVVGAGTEVTDSGLAYDFVDHAYYAAVLRVEAGATVIGRGGRPLVLVGLREIFVEGGATVSVSARGRVAGPTGLDGANGSDGLGMLGVGGGGQSCNSTTGHREGGGGASFGTPGGGAGDGPDGTLESASPGPLPVVIPDELVGGFGGGGGCLTSAGGSGGGALYLFSRTIVRVDGTLVSGGGGGEGGAIGDGGGGGGSGGRIVVEAPVVDLDGEIHVMGGSGGEGSGAPSMPVGSVAVAGASGTDGNASGAAARTPITNDGCGPGGRGSDPTGIAGRGGSTTTAPNRTGGGGGGAGVVTIIRVPLLVPDMLHDHVVPDVGPVVEPAAGPVLFELPPTTP